MRCGQHSIPHLSLSHIEPPSVAQVTFHFFFAAAAAVLVILFMGRMNAAVLLTNQIRAQKH